MNSMVVSLSGIFKSKTVIRLVALGLLLLSFLGPWLADIHPATEETCISPLAWVGDGHCACIVSLVLFYKTIGDWEEWLGIPPLLPILFTLLYFLAGNRRFLRYLYISGWFLVALYSLFFFFVGLYQGLFQWGSGFGGLVAILLLVWEIMTSKIKSVAS